MGAVQKTMGAKEKGLITIKHMLTAEKKETAKLMEDGWRDVVLIRTT